MFAMQLTGTVIGGAILAVGAVVVLLSIGLRRPTSNAPGGDRVPLNR